MKTSDKIQDQIKANIKRLIKERKLTLSVVAERMGVKQPALSQVINGNPTIEMLEHIANVLGVEVRVFFEGSGSGPFGLVEYKGHPYRIESVESLKSLISTIEST